MAAELLGENDVVLLLCVPELVPALLWSSLSTSTRAARLPPWTRSNQTETGWSSSSAQGGGGVAGSATWRPPWMSMEFLQVCDDFGVLWSFRASCVSVFMLRQWPAHGTAKATVSCLEEAAQLHKFWADALLVVAAALLVPTSLAAVRLLHEQARFLH